MSSTITSLESKKIHFSHFLLITFLATVAQQWEEAAQSASAAGIRTVNMRTGVVLSPEAGMLDKLLLPFKLGLGGIVGNGKQYLSWVSIHEIINMIQFLLENVSLAISLVGLILKTNYCL